MKLLIAALVCSVMLSAQPRPQAAPKTDNPPAAQQNKSASRTKKIVIIAASVGLAVVSIVANRK